ncbi:hypothetical protein yc1106_07923 [Curvularia clavata]|uniref:Uncharacterized protein n=1 Tax=Curvularia clavata TaxID=95742 RepID=A0A9Q9DW90_CURCL|nr:hypothetical protein yc1106_07923 [Curvularia clavata]
MGPSPNIPYNPSAQGAPPTLLPEEVFGHIDVATLADIHRYLRESEAQDDIDLAAWIQDNYLYSIEKDQATAIIRTSHGFAQLDRAYRRVRSLTNKAQDKWPFFDKNFKEMSSATVRNNARGEAAPGVLYPIDSPQRATPSTQQLGTAPVSNGLDAPDASSPKLQTPFVPVKPSGDQGYKQQCIGLAPQTPAPLPSPPIQRPGSETRSIHSENSAKDHSNCSEMNAEVENRATIGSEERQPMASSVEAMHDSEIGVAHAAIKDIGTESPSATEAVLSGIDGEDVKPDHIRDAGRGKVRGPNGQYLPKDKVLPSGKKAKKPKGKGGKSSMKSVQPSGMDTVQSSPEKPDNIFVQVQTPSTPPPDQKAGDQSATTAAHMLAVTDTTPPLTAVNEAENRMVSLAAPTPAYLLAAEAEAVPSNLDRLPPSSRKGIKRKSETTVQEGERKRGKYGGIVGRPRKSEQREARKGVDEQGLKTETESSLQMTTRRSARRSAVSNLDAPQSAEATEDAAGNDSEQAKNQETAEDTSINEKIAETEDVTMGGTEENTTTGHNDTSTPARNSRKKGARSSADAQPPSATPKNKHATNGPGQRLKLNLDKTRLASLGVQDVTSRKDMENKASPSITAAPEGIKKTNGRKKTHHAGHVELFARLTTSNGTIEVPVPADQLNSDEISMLEKYAEWNAQPNAAPVPYDQFRQIVSFAKKD